MRIMFKTFYPDEYVASTYVLDFEKMYREGCRGLVFDIDNTLVPHVFLTGCAASGLIHA